MIRIARTDHNPITGKLSQWLRAIIMCKCNDHDKYVYESKTEYHGKNITTHYQYTFCRIFKAKELSKSFDNKVPQSKSSSLPTYNTESKSTCKITNQHQSDEFRRDSKFWFIYKYIYWFAMVRASSKSRNWTFNKRICYVKFWISNLSKNIPLIA